MLLGAPAHSLTRGRFLCERGLICDLMQVIRELGRAASHAAKVILLTSLCRSAWSLGPDGPNIRKGLRPLAGFLRLEKLARGLASRVLQLGGLHVTFRQATLGFVPLLLAKHPLSHVGV